jgi:hypothetical protein
MSPLDVFSSAAIRFPRYVGSISPTLFARRSGVFEIELRGIKKYPDSEVAIICTPKSTYLTFPAGKTVISGK